MKAIHHSQDASSARNRQRRRFLYANAPYLALIPLGVVTFYPPAYQYAAEVYFAACVVFALAIVRLSFSWVKERAKNKAD